MDASKIIGLVTKGLTVAGAVWEDRDLAFKAIKSLENIVTMKDPTPADIAATESDLDGLLDEFNAPLPPD